MQKKVRSLISLMMSLVLLLSVSVWGGAVSAQETAVQPRFSYTAYTATALDITTNGVAWCTAGMEGYDGITTKVHIKMTLQKHTVLWWSNQETWEGTFYDVVGTLCQSTSVNKGTYRVKAVYTVYSGSASEEITGTSQEKQYNP